MRLIDIVTGPWAVTPKMLDEIQEIYCAHLRGPKLDIKAIEEKIGKPLNNERTNYKINEQGVAVIDAIGVSGKRMNIMTQISGGVSTEILGNDIMQALDDPSVKALILNIDSPGGTVDGTQELANLIFESRGKKPMVAYTDGMVASAAYWVASAMDGIYISGDTNPIGSIGVRARHVDISKAEEMAGIKSTVISSGKYKAVGSKYKPLSAEDKGVMQDELDYLYSVFVNGVARNRGVSVETVLEKMADGRIFIGAQAIEAGLVDGQSSIEKLTEMLSSGVSIHKTFPVGGVPSGTDGGVPSVASKQLNLEEKEMEMKDVTLEMLKKDRPELVNQVLSAASKEELEKNSTVKDIVASAVHTAEAAKDATIGKIVTDTSAGILANAKKDVMDGLSNDDLQKHPQFLEAAKDYVGKLSADELEKFPQVIEASKGAAAVQTEFLSNLMKANNIHINGNGNNGKHSTLAGVFKKTG